MAARNKALHKAQKAKNDEFYTSLSDIEKELDHYKSHFKDKVIYCNCDNPSVSNFWKYFRDNFEALEVKELIATYHVEDGETYKTIYNGVDEVREQLLGNGDFNSDECVEILIQSDIVVTNPPFSLFRDFINLLIKHNKHFLVIGNVNAITYKEFFPLLMNNKVWLGHNHNHGAMTFKTKDGSEKKVFTYWYTNLETSKRHEPLTLTKTYDPESYPKYDNYEAINVNKVSDIPKDYDGVMGVPITFLDKYCPEQFEILGDSRFHDGQDFSDDINIINGKLLYRRLLIRRCAKWIETKE